MSIQTEQTKPNKWFVIEWTQDDSHFIIRAAQSSLTSACRYVDEQTQYSRSIVNKETLDWLYSLQTTRMKG